MQIKKDLLPHQILLTHQIISARRRKFLIADEVGLGKTIEVGMIIKELLARGEAKRILIICPAGLTVNWQNEMKDCFRIFCSAMISKGMECRLPYPSLRIK